MNMNTNTNTMKSIWHRCISAITILSLNALCAIVVVESAKQTSTLSLILGLLAAYVIVQVNNKYSHVVFPITFMKYGIGYEPFLLGVLYYIGIIFILKDLEQIEDKFYTLSALMYLSNLFGIYVCEKGVFNVWSKNEIKQFHKLNSMHRLITKGLNVHSFIPCRTREEILYACKELGNTCTIRTDKHRAEQGSQLKFYTADNLSDTEILKIADKIIKDNCIAIVANGLKYDKYLKYNVVYYIRESGDFIIEYSKVNVPLRHMYKFPYSLNTAKGNINDDIRDWSINKAVSEKDRVDLREIKELLIEEYDVCLKNKMFGKYIEMSTYTEEVGVYKERKVYWEA